MKVPSQKAAVAAAAIACAAVAGCAGKSETAGGPLQTMQPEHGLKMLAYVTDFVKISPRDSGTLNASKSSRWIAQEIRRLGLKPVADTWTENTAFGRKTFSNIYVDIPGRSPDIILLGSHYDTKVGMPPGFQGANDGGSSTGVLLGLIEHFANTRPDLHYTIRFAFFDGEEAVGNTYSDDDGLHGSKRMAEMLARGKADTPLLAAIIVDMVGDYNHRLDIPRNVTPWLATIAVREAQAGPSGAKVNLASTIVIDDHLPFLVHGFPALNLIDFEYGSASGKHDYWHTEHDTIDKINPDSLLKTANLVIGILGRIENGTDVPAELRRSVPAATAQKPQ